MNISKSKYLYWLLRSLPNFLWPLKYFIIKISLKKAGRNFRFGEDSFFWDFRFIEIGDNVFMGNRSTINSSVLVTIGNNVMFGPEVMIIGGDHNFEVPGILMRNVKTGGTNLPIVIEDDVWVGARSIILKGVKISEGAIIGAGSLVTRSVLPYSINVGHPSRFVRPRFNLNQLSFHLQEIKSKYSLDEIKNIYSKENIILE